MNRETLEEIGVLRVGPQNSPPASYVSPIVTAQTQFGNADWVREPRGSQAPFDAHRFTDGLMWRQSMIHDILRCPRMAAQEWIYSTAPTAGGALSPVEDDAKRGFIAAVFGTAAHAVIEQYNLALSDSETALKYSDLLEIFETEAEKEYDITSEIIPIPKKCATFTEAMQSVGADYMQYIIGHIAYEKTRKPLLTVTASEQKFVMLVSYLGDFYFFTGMIDQMAVCKTDGRLFLRDFKFRDNAFKPTWRQLQVDPQMIIYSCAMKYGVPSCPECAPTYVSADNSAENLLTALNHSRKVVYDGPCDKCKAKLGSIDPNTGLYLGTHLWPREFPDEGELIWMKDYRILKRGNAYRKKGEIAGDGVYQFKFNSSNAEAYMEDVMQHCRAFRYGFHPRKYGEACKFWCRHAQSCVNELVGDGLG